MNKKTITTSSKDIASKLTVLGVERKDMRHKFTTEEKQLGLKVEKLAVIAKKKRGIKKKSIGRKLAVVAKNLKISSKNREAKRAKFTVAEKKLTLLTKKFAAVIKEKEEIKEKLKTSELHFKTLFENSRDALMVLESPTWKYTHGNQAALKMFIVKDDSEFSLKEPWALSPERQLDGRLSSEKAKDMIKIAVRNGSNFFEWTHRRFNGESFPASVLLTRVKLSKKNIFLQATVRDITKEKELDKAKDEFISLAAHQLRTPITAISWNLEMLLDEKRGPLNKKQKEILGEIYKSGKNMAELVSGFLDVTKMESSSFAVEKGDVDLLQVSDSVLAELANQISVKKINVVKKYGNNIPYLDIGIKTARVIFQNLISNAVKYTPEGGTVGVNIEKIDEEISISIKDNGYGIEKKDKSQIFTKLFRADNIKEKEPSGTGLGLYLLKNLVDKSGGKVWFESKESAGSTFYVNLKLPPR